MNNTAWPNWVNNKTFVFAMLLIIFPVGLYALWAGNVFARDMKWKITGAVIVTLIFFSSTGLGDLIYTFGFLPAGVYLCWKDKAIPKSTTYKYSGAAAVLFLLSVFTLGNSGDNNLGQSCTAVTTEGNCTYFRDSQCNVIGKTCQ